MRFADQTKKKAITFSYDDGITQDIRLIELLNKYGLKSTFNINSQRFGDEGVLNVCGQNVSHNRLRLEEIKSVYNGHEIAAHTLTHPNLTQCDDEEVIRQVEIDRLNLSDIAGYEVVGMAYPGGGINNDERIINLIQNHTGIQYSRTTIPTHNFDLQENLLHFNPTASQMHFDKIMELGQEFISLQTETPKIFYIWGHSYELDAHPNFWPRLEEFFKLISNRDDIFYGTNKEVLL